MQRETFRRLSILISSLFVLQAATGYEGGFVIVTPPPPPPPPQVSVSVIISPPDSGGVHAPSQVAIGSTVTLRAVETPNAEFSHWSTDEGFILFDPVYSFVASNASRFTAHF